MAGGTGVLASIVLACAAAATAATAVAAASATAQASAPAVSGPCVPQDFLALRPQYDKDLAQCRDGACLENAMRSFQARLAATARQCARSPAPMKWLDRPVEPALRARLRRLIAKHGENFEEDPDSGPDSLAFNALRLGGREAVAVVQQNGAHNSPFRLMLRDRPGKGKPPPWRIVLENYGGYLRPLEGTDAVRNGLPVLRTQQHASCCEHQVDYYAYDGRRYAPSLHCTQLYDGGSPVLFCDDPAEDRRGPAGTPGKEKEK